MGEKYDELIKVDEGQKSQNSMSNNIKIKLFSAWLYLSGLWMICLGCKQAYWGLGIIPIITAVKVILIQITGKKQVFDWLS